MNQSVVDREEWAGYGEVMPLKKKEQRSASYERVIVNLRKAYDRKADARNRDEISAWKIEERADFLSLMNGEGKRTLLEIGAGTGLHGKFFQESGLAVVCTDLAPENVRLCQEKGLTAYCMDFMHLEFPGGSFEAVFALNCLLHVPKHALPPVLQVIYRVLKPGGLFFLGQYGGQDFEGVWPEDAYEPKRFYSFYTDDGLQKVVTGIFKVERFKRVPVEGRGEFHFQSMILRRD